MNAFPDGVAPGGLYDSRDIKMLVCYMLLGVGQPFPRDAVVDIIAGNEMANLFETSAAIDDLVRLRNVLEDENGLLTLTDTGRQSADELVHHLPFTLRERSLKAALAVLARARFEKETKVEIADVEPGVSITCSADTSEHPMMSFTLRVADRAQAEMIRDRFLTDPTAFYRALIALATDDCEKTDNELIIRFS